MNCLVIKSNKILKYIFRPLTTVPKIWDRWFLISLGNNFTWLKFTTSLDESVSTVMLRFTWLRWCSSLDDVPHHVLSRAWQLVITLLTQHQYCNILPCHLTRRLLTVILQAFILLDLIAGWLLFTYPWQQYYYIVSGRCRTRFSRKLR